MIDIVPATAAHIGTIAARMRSIDVLEASIGGRTPKEALRLSLWASAVAWTAKVDGRAEAMFGVSPVSTIEGIGSPWMLCTDDAMRHGRAFVELGRIYSDEIFRRFPVLGNRVHADNLASIRWLAHLGYTIGPVSIINGERMRDFERRG